MGRRPVPKSGPRSSGDHRYHRYRHHRCRYRDRCRYRSGTGSRTGPGPSPGPGPSIPSNVTVPAPIPVPAPVPRYLPVPCAVSRVSCGCGGGSALGSSRLVGYKKYKKLTRENAHAWPHTSAPACDNQRHTPGGFGNSQCVRRRPSWVRGAVRCRTALSVRCASTPIRGAGPASGVPVRMAMGSVLDLV